MVEIKNLNFEELQNFVQSLGFENYRAKQIAQWIYKKRVKSFDEMTNISKAARKVLSENAKIDVLKLVKVEKSMDGTKKYLFELEDGNRVESVFIPEKDWNTLCVSTQVGCPVGCKFCLTAKDGFTRNLTAAEIVDQYIHVQRDVGEDKRISNVVFMGMGEPFLNFENVKKAVEIMTDKNMLDLSTRKITISTVGVVPGIDRMAKEMNKVKLAISLHATTDEVREKIVPLNRKYPISEIMAALRRYPADNIRRIMIEYVMLEGVNDSVEDAKRLVKLVKGIPVKVNLIPFNSYPGAPFKPSSKEQTEKFQKVLWDHNIAAFIRDSRGQDISAACGMLRTKEKCNRC
ncbi:Ribosomal RNA large subunit methyltransferase N [Desulfurobacterium thermolithotrophum DSM 11699]|uniref:Probable dual-specificity RNA methyltransferase RlmN n=1 Tax=Desulfurobacterium thermolithotrophum (strain DSM 11699 / BSA) TaxID=868864 RepID=F0S3B4_DESTD|nr:23S rRNA (adenine(2503)-C(2))-methyltransferase RlmN [Desulfurobacterium thermolithotrophum]ADY73336.1 Ribosomal RNA large subunit methyltransferase N [Desulfurobacterium thermolithotrophum DSM 11699]